jgi:hypothetical protein
MGYGAVSGALVTPGPAQAVENPINMTHTIEASTLKVTIVLKAYQIPKDLVPPEPAPAGNPVLLGRPVVGSLPGTELSRLAT